jgi:UDP-N-acetylenolpyruvoylglucosamine reductase
MNAGAMGVEMFDQVVDVTVLDEEGNVRTLAREDVEVHYRNVPFLRRNFALEVTLTGPPDTPENIQERWDASRNKRRFSQPIAASAGCMFKNPTLVPAGKLVDELGLKGTRHGKAEVSTVHGNFIVNTGGARTGEILALVEEIRQKAREERGVEMEMEVKIIGEDESTF